MLSGLPIVFTQGFSPHPKTSFCPPLSSGIEGENEFYDIWLSELYSDDFILSSLSKVMVKDLNFNRVSLLQKDGIYAANYTPISDYTVESLIVQFPDITIYKKNLNEYLASNDTTYIKTKKDREKTVDLKHIILDIKWNGNVLCLTKKVQGASVFDVLDKIFELKREDAEGYLIIRKQLLLNTSTTG
jgi:radical SAM-linked protein